MKDKHLRQEAIKIILSSREIGSQEEILQELIKEGFTLTQATLSRDLKQLKVAKAASMNGSYVYVLPNDTMYKRSTTVKPVKEMMQTNGLLNIRFSGNIGVIKTRPGYASSMAFDIDMENIPYIIGTVAGDDTIVIVLEEGTPKETVRRQIQSIL